VGGSEGVYFVPAFAGLFAPHWREDARGTVCGLTAFHEKKHLVKACLDAACFQALEVLEAMEKDSGVKLGAIKVPQPRARPLLRHFPFASFGAGHTHAQRRTVLPSVFTPPPQPTNPRSTAA